MENSLIAEAYGRLCASWGSLKEDERDLRLERFKVVYSYNSGSLENPEITYHDTAEVFDKNSISNFSGDVRTIYEITNLKHAWSWLMDAVCSNSPFTLAMLLDAHRVLTAETYDEDRWAKGERPGTFKRGDYRVADNVGLPPEEVEPAVRELLEEMAEAMKAHGTSANASKNALTIAAYAHARLVDIHPFADGNGRVARLFMNYVFMALKRPPCSISVDDRMAYFGALNAFHVTRDLAPFKTFLQVQALKTWNDEVV